MLILRFDFFCRLSSAFFPQLAPLVILFPDKTRQVCLSVYPPLLLFFFVAVVYYNSSVMRATYFLLQSHRLFLYPISIVAHTYPQSILLPYLYSFIFYLSWTWQSPSNLFRLFPFFSRLLFSRFVEKRFRWFWYAFLILFFRISERQRSVQPSATTWSAFLYLF